MDLLKMGAQLFISKLGGNGGNFDVATVVSSLSNLLPTSGGDLDLASLVGKMKKLSVEGTCLGDFFESRFQRTYDFTKNAISYLEYF